MYLSLYINQVFEFIVSMSALSSLMHLISSCLSQQRIVSFPFLFYCCIQTINGFEKDICDVFVFIGKSNANN